MPRLAPTPQGLDATPQMSLRWARGVTRDSLLMAEEVCHKAAALSVNTVAYVA